MEYIALSKKKGKTYEGIWLYGNLIEIGSKLIFDHRLHALPEDAELVNSETIEHFTGKIVAGGKELYTGDIFVDDQEVASVVRYNESKCMFMIDVYDTPITYNENGGEIENPIDVVDSFPLDDIDTEYFNSIIIKGNVHDNPEMLKG